MRRKIAWLVIVALRTWAEGRSRVNGVLLDWIGWRIRVNGWLGEAITRVGDWGLGR